MKREKSIMQKTKTSEKYLQALLAFVAALVTVMTNHITWIESRSRASEGRRGTADKGTISCNMARLATAIANRAIEAISCQMSRLATIVARLLVRTVNSKMAWSITVVAEPCFGNPSFLCSTTLR
jgi:hypothetical protein